MNDRTLVLYASKYGSTAELAEAVADELRQAGVSVDVADAGAAPELGPYGTVILGSAIYMGRWRREARRFVKRRAPELFDRDVWLFSSGPVGEAKPDYTGRFADPPFPKKYGPKIGAHEHVVFGGRIDPESAGFMGRAMAKDMPEELRDRRDWDQIRAWARKIATGGASAPPQASGRTERSAGRESPAA